MQANALIAHLEGLFGSGISDGFFSRATATDAKPRQRAITWLSCLKLVMRSDRELREATDWNIVQSSDAVNADAELDSSGGTVYAVFVDSIFDVAGEHLVVLVADTGNGGGQTMDAPALDMGGEGGANQTAIVVKLPVASTTAPEYGMVIIPDGLAMTTSVQVMADGEEGTAPTANDVRVWVIYRSDTEVRSS